ncbi:RnfH family protein [Pseudomonas sp. Irchel 3E20]|uniref:RnfH family protein n=1 Tax=Pseudomonas sp. Irchel 3E20 TaxID=2008983 RepID=UPI000BA4876E|nr:RnfH family protein [Pseudomonas sp. Irchel 3E20]
MVEPLIEYEVVYAEPERQVLLKARVAHGTSVRAALRESGVAAQFPKLDLEHCQVGIFGKVVADPQARLIEEGDRIEIYRPLLADPKEVRRLRAAKAAQAKAMGL